MLESFTDEQLGWQLNYELSKGYDIVKISCWADSVHFNTRNITPMQNEVLGYLMSMQNDPQFEFTEKELRWLAELLQNGEQNPIKKVLEKEEQRYVHS